MDWQVTAAVIRNRGEASFGILKEQIARFRRRWPMKALQAEVEIWGEEFAWLFNQNSAYRRKQAGDPQISPPINP